MNGLRYLAAAHASIWVGLWAYAATLAGRQKSLARALDELRAVVREGR